MKFSILLLAATLSVLIADYVEIGGGGTLATNRPFCGS